MSYPILVSSYDNSPKHQQRLLNAIDTAETARAAGTIPNVTYQEIKTIINRALENATDYDHRATSGWDYHTSTPQLHTIAGFVKKLGFNDEGSKKEAFLKEIAPLGELFAALKDMVSKRQPKTTSDDPRDPRYAPPPVTTIAAKKVHALLTDLVAENFGALVQAFVSGMKGQVKMFLIAKQKAADEGKTLSLRRFAEQVRGADINFLSRVTHDDRPRSMEVLIDDDVDNTILTQATKDAEEIREMFVAKNLRKIVSIMDAKENAGVVLSEVKVIGRQVSIGGLTGEFHASFADGSSFDFTNSVVWVMNQQGTQFNRFPLNFHNVKLAGGVKMPRPSEERMNTVFVGG